MFETSHHTQSALGAALQAAYKMAAPTGGRITLFQVGKLSKIAIDLEFDAVLLLDTNVATVKSLLNFVKEFLNTNSWRNSFRNLTTSPPGFTKSL